MTLEDRRKRHRPKYGWATAAKSTEEMGLCQTSQKGASLGFWTVKMGRGREEMYFQAHKILLMKPYSKDKTNALCALCLD